MAMDWNPVGAVIGGAANFFSQKDANKANREISREQMNFQSIMSRTAHQREVEDLKAAGLNPILSANAGASTPQGASATMQAPQIDMPAIQAAAQFETQKKQFEVNADQNQQRINIDKANSTATIAKALTGAQLDRANRLSTEGGIGTKFLGTKTYEELRKPIGPPIKSFMQKAKDSLSAPKFNQPSSGGNLP